MALINVAGEPVCGARLETLRGPDIYCTYPPEHPKIIDGHGRAWDHGLISEPRTKWRSLLDE